MEKMRTKEEILEEMKKYYDEGKDSFLLEVLIDIRDLQDSLNKKILILIEEIFETKRLLGQLVRK